MRTILLAMALLALGASPAAAKVLNIAHRGASGHAPEHTFPAYDLALKMGADYIEQDLQMTRDGTLVVLHADTLDRTARGPASDCTGTVRSKTLAQLRRCEVGSWFDKRFAGARIPTLDEVFRRYGRKARYYIETKSPEQAPGMEEALLALLDQHGLRDRVILQSFSPASLIKLHDLAPELPLVQLLPGGGAVVAKLPLVRQYAIGIGPTKDDVTPELVADAHANGLVVHPYTVNEAAELASLVKMGVDGAFTNFPDRFAKVLRR